MADVGYHFANLWVAADKQNWPLANYYLGETRSHLKWAVRIHAVRKTSTGAEVDLNGILEAVDNSFLAEVEQCDYEQRRGKIRDRVPWGNPSGLLCLPSGVRKAVPSSAGAECTGRVHSQFRSRRQLAEMKRLRSPTQPQGTFMRTFLRNVAASGSAFALLTTARADDIVPTVMSPPAHTALRYDEDYSYLEDPAARTDLFDPLKYIPLNESGDWYVTLGGELRDRYEYFNNYTFGSGAQDKDGYNLLRVMPHADVHLGEYLRVLFYRGNQRHGTRPRGRAAPERRERG